MVIYGEYLFLENAVAGLIILAITSRICGMKPSLKKLALGSFLCGVYAFILFWENISWWLSGFFKLVFSFVVVILVFPILNRKGFFKTLLVFYMISFAAGGIVIASLYFFNSAGITSGGVFYVGHITYIRVFSGMLLSWIILYIFSNFLKERLRKGRDEAKLGININGKTMILNGFIDTGNFLRDPISGRPVCIASKKAVGNIVAEATQFCAVPFKSIGNEEGVLEGIRLDDAQLLIKGKEPKSVNIVLAYSKTERLMGGNGDSYDVILHEALIERGVLSNE